MTGYVSPEAVEENNLGGKNKRKPPKGFGGEAGEQGSEMSFQAVSGYHSITKPCTSFYCLKGILVFGFKSRHKSGYSP